MKEVLEKSRLLIFYFNFPRLAHFRRAGDYPPGGGEIARHKEEPYPFLLSIRFSARVIPTHYRGKTSLFPPEERSSFFKLQPGHLGT